MSRIKIPASNAIKGENVVKRMVTASLRVCAIAVVVVSQPMPLNRIRTGIRSLSFMYALHMDV